MPTPGPLRVINESEETLTPVLLLERRDSVVENTRIAWAREIANARERQRELEAEERRRREEQRRRVALENQAREEGLRRELQQRLAREREEREVRERIEREQREEVREQREQEEQKNQSVMREVIRRRKVAERAERRERQEELDRIERQRGLTLEKLEANKRISPNLAAATPATQERGEVLRTEIGVHIERERRQREQRAQHELRLQQVYEESQKWADNIIPRLEAIIKEETSRSVVVSVQEAAQVENYQSQGGTDDGAKRQEC